LTVKEVAELLGTTEQTIRVGLQQGVFPFGVAFKRSKKGKNYTYVIYPKKVTEYVEVKQ
jgi:predicted transcriptional regulator